MSVCVQGDDGLPGLVGPDGMVGAPGKPGSSGEPGLPGDSVSSLIGLRKYMYNDLLVSDLFLMSYVYGI